MHQLILGQTESGKSCLAKIIAKELHSSGRHVAVLDPMGDSWECSYITKDSEKFDAYLKANRNVFFFVDEAGEVFRNGSAREYFWWTSWSRHLGHSATIVGVRATLVPMTMRDQCHRLHLFTSSYKDGQTHAEEWNKDQLLECNTFPKFCFWTVSRYEIAIPRKVVDYTKIGKWNGRPDSNNGGADRSNSSRNNGGEVD